MTHTFSSVATDRSVAILVGQRPPARHHLLTKFLWHTTRPYTNLKGLHIAASLVLDTRIGVFGLHLTTVWDENGLWPSENHIEMGRLNLNSSHQRRIWEAHFEESEFVLLHTAHSNNNAKSFDQSVDGILNSLTFFAALSPNIFDLKAVRHRSQGGWLQIIPCGCAWNLELEKRCETISIYHIFGFLRYTRSSSL